MLDPSIALALAGARRVLLAGCGGGYDLFGAVPLYHALRASGVEVHLASLSFCYLNGLDGARQHPRAPNLYAVDAACAREDEYCPEAWLADFLAREDGYTLPIHCFDKTGVLPLRAAYQHLVGELALDAIVLVDGGVDALLRGDEHSLGTPQEDHASIAAVSRLPGVRTLLACVGMGTEMRDGIQHAQVFARIAELTQEGGYLGASALLATTPGGALYRRAVLHAFEHQQHKRQSHVHRCIVEAMEGRYGAPTEHIWLSPLMNLFWYFDLATVARTSLVARTIEHTQSIWEVGAVIEGVRRELKIRPREPIPI